MRKSENITKYNLAWQLLRVSIKGSKIDYDEKIEKVVIYFEQKKCLQRYERVYNYLEGLYRGYKAARRSDKMLVIDATLTYLRAQKPHLKMVEEEADNWDCLSDKEMKKIGVMLYKDLHHRGKRWLENGYTHTEQEAFMDKLYNALVKVGEGGKLDKYRTSHLTLRTQAGTIKNTHKFFF